MTLLLQWRKVALRLFPNQTSHYHREKPQTQFCSSFKRTKRADTTRTPTLDYENNVKKEKHIYSRKREHTWEMGIASSNRCYYRWLNWQMLRKPGTTLKWVKTFFTIFPFLLSFPLLSSAFPLFLPLSSSSVCLLRPFVFFLFLVQLKPSSRELHN